MIHSNTNYIEIGDPFALLAQNLTFQGIRDDHSAAEETTLIALKAIEVEHEGDIIVRNVTARNSSVTFLHFWGVDGHTEQTKNVVFEDFVITDAEFDSYNDLIAFGPLYTEEDVAIRVSG